MFKALDNVSFSIEQGEVVGIIGHNGAGKSTLLKMLAKISTPSSGSVKVKGRIAPLIEVGAGFVPDFTGRENVYLNGAILGMPKQEIDRKFDEIVDFAEVAEFIDTPVKRYSSGMQVKLAFAVATSIESEILIIDEVLAVGDLAFQRKCFERMESLIKNQGRTVIIVSHNLRQIERICRRAILLDSGRILWDDDAASACNMLYDINDSKIQGYTERQTHRVSATGEIDLLGIKLIDESGIETKIAEHDTSPTLEITIRVNSIIPNPSFFVGLHTIDFFYINTSVCPPLIAPEILVPGEYLITLRMNSIPFINGGFSVRLRVETGHIGKIIFYGENLFHFQAIKQGLMRMHLEADGILQIPMSWGIISNTAIKEEKFSMASATAD
jgi:ABC-type polysaccharide/polyol phosphate transport system ATPase subunit